MNNKMVNLQKLSSKIVKESALLTGNAYIYPIEIGVPQLWKFFSKNFLFDCFQNPNSVVYTNPRFV